ncbi:HEAT repeat domain-containing protein [Kitasatospora sp. NPDC004289]
MNALNVMTSVDAAWSRLGRHDGSAEAVAELRRIARGEPADGYQLFYRLYRDPTGMEAFAPDALPFLTALARDPSLPDRHEVAATLFMLVGAARTQPAERIAPGWHAAWRSCRAAAEHLIEDPDPRTRRWAVDLVERHAPLLERLRSEEEPAVRIKLLMRLGELAAGSSDSDDARLALEAAATASAALRLAALRGLARLDPEGAAGLPEQLVTVFREPGAAASVGAEWDLPDPEYRTELPGLILGTAEDLPGPLAARFTSELARTGELTYRTAALDAAWKVLVVRPSAGPGLVRVAGELLDDPEPAVRVRAANLLAVLGPSAAPFADALLAHLDDPGEDELRDGRVTDYAHWALGRIGDPRVMPRLVDGLTALDREPGRGYQACDPHRPEPYDALLTLEEHAGALRPALLELARAGSGTRPGRTAAAVLSAWDGTTPPWEPTLRGDLEATAARLTEMPPLYQPWQDPLTHLAAVAAVAALSRRGPLAPPVRSAVEHVLSLDRRLAVTFDYRAFLDDERLRAVLRRALDGEAVRMPHLCLPTQC